LAGGGGRPLYDRSVRFALIFGIVPLFAACGDDQRATDDTCEPGRARVCMTDAGLGLQICTRAGTFSEECFLDDECNVLAQTGCPDGRYCFIVSETICAPDGVYPCAPGERLMTPRTGDATCTPFCDLAGHPDGIDPEHCPEGLWCRGTTGVSDDIGVCITDDAD
jgi:hypothetical protein